MPQQMLAVPALEARLEAWRFAARFAGRAEALGAAASLLAGACLEVQRSDLLRTLLKVALLAGERAGQCIARRENRGLVWKRSKFAAAQRPLHHCSLSPSRPLLAFPHPQALS